MKRIAILVMLASAAVACAPKDGYVIDGRIDGLEGEISLVDAYDHVVQSSQITDGRFRFEGSVDKPQLMYVNNGLGKEFPIDTPVLLENARIKLRGDVKTFNIKVTGTRPNVAMTEYIRRKKQLNELDTEAYAALVRETFEANSDNLLGSMLIPNLAPYVSHEELLACCEKLPADLRADKIVSHYEQFAQANVNTAVGRPFVDFSIDGPDGAPVALADVVASHEATVLVFWATWARMSSETMSAFAKAARPYEARGATMMCVSSDYDAAKCAEAAQAAGLFGLSFCGNVEQAKAAGDLYGIDGLPRALLIGRDGTILCRTKSPMELEVALRNLFAR